MAQTYRYPAGASLAISSQGTNGAANPSTSLQVGGKSPSNTLLPIAVDASGNIIVSLLSNAFNLAQVGGVAISLGQKLMAASVPVVLSSDQSALAITAASLPLPAGAATSAKQDTGNTSLGSIDTSAAAINAKTPALGQALAAASVPVVLTAAQLSTLTPLATVAATQSGTWNITNISGTVSLPTGAATETTLAAASAKLPATLGQKAMAASLAVAIASDQGALTISLPTGAATSALQTTGNTSLASIDTKTPALGQALAAASVPVVLTAAQLTTLTPLSTVAATQSGAWSSRTNDGSGVSVGSKTVNTETGLNISQIGRAASTKSRIDYSSTPVTTSAYTQVVASTAVVIREVEIFDSSGQSLVLAVGAAASEVDQIYIFPGGNGRIPLSIAGGSRVSIKAVSGSATSGESLINFYA
jgi:hypothetical protein